MDYMIEIHNRIQIGFAVGFSWYRLDELNDVGEFIILLGLISVNIKYMRSEI